MKKHLLLIGLILVTQSLFAVETSTIKIERGDRPKNLLSIDSFPMILGGAGIGLDRVITSGVTLGIFGNNETLKANNSGDNSMKLQTIGIRSRYFTAGDATEKGWYFGGTLVSVNLKTTVRVLPTDAEGSASDKETGFLGMAGYQLRGNNFGQGRFIVNLGILAGTGMGAKFEARSTSGVSSVNTTVGSGVGAEASLGFMF